MKRRQGCPWRGDDSLRSLSSHHLLRPLDRVDPDVLGPALVLVVVTFDRKHDRAFQADLRVFDVDARDHRLERRVALLTVVVEIHLRQLALAPATPFGRIHWAGAAGEEYVRGGAKRVVPTRERDPSVNQLLQGIT